MTSDDGRRDIVLGCATDYTYDRIVPFASTLRRSGYQGEVALFVYSDQLESLQILVDEFDFTLVAVSRNPKYLPASIGRRLQNGGRIKHVHWFLSKTVSPIATSSSLLALVARMMQFFYHVDCSRYFLYYDFLYGKTDQYKYVLFSDVRDVVFQGDPFRYAIPEQLSYFLDASLKLGDEPINVEWVTGVFGREYCRERLGQAISCSGTVLADYQQSMRYLKKMCVELIRRLPRAVGLFGPGQAVHNYLWWEGQLTHLAAHSNGENSVMTLKNDPLDGFGVNEQGELLNYDASLAPVLHQYDCHPVLKRNIEDRLLGAE